MLPQPNSVSALASLPLTTFSKIFHHYLTESCSTLSPLKIPICSKGHGIIPVEMTTCKQCEEELGKETYTFYFPIEDRIILALLQSDLAPLLDYPNLRSLPEEHCFSDWWDGMDWKDLLQEFPKLSGTNTIVLNVCWDVILSVPFSIYIPPDLAYAYRTTQLQRRTIALSIASFLSTLPLLLVCLRMTATYLPFRTLLSLTKSHRTDQKPMTRTDNPLYKCTRIH